MILRNIKLFFRDKVGVFFSFLAVIILFGLYVLFLGDTVVKGLGDMPGAEPLMMSWIMAGIIAIAAITTTMGAFSTMVEDRSKKISKDFYASPIPRWKITASYLISSIIIGLIMTLLTFVFAQVYIIIKGGEILAIKPMLLMLAYIVLSVVSSSSMVFFLVSFFKSQSAFSAASTVLGTMIGFLTGMYVPIGSLPGAIQWVIKLFPISHSVALIRQVLMKVPLSVSFANMPPQALEEFQKTMGVYYWFGDVKLNAFSSILILIATTIVFFGLSVLNMSRKNK